jgi:glycosyltransferase involved in cell wall biosynthesis/SAM-dependent methyltransferase
MNADNPSDAAVALPALVSCILPTHNRRAFFTESVRYFRHQDYSDKELIVVDDGTDCVRDLIPDDPRIRYFRLDSRHTVGTKRNLACEHASGDIILHWDDDDWQAGWRVSYQISELLKSNAQLCGLDRLLYYEPSADRAWQYCYPKNNRPWVSGNTLCYKKSFWQQHRFAEINVAEDARFVWRAAAEDVLRLDDHRFIVALIHGDNVSPKITRGAYWTPQPVSAIQELMGQDFPIGATAAQRPESAPRQAERTAAILPSRDYAMTHAHKNDLALPEFAAYREQLTIPFMRTWELPYALFSAQLADTMAVFDCTINPAGFGERMGQLYPHVLYRHWNPTRGGTFCLPAGFPDAAFDRVFCINTLEHLLAPQRQALVADLARKLKPGGRLILTSDYYFDSFWSQPEMLKAGLVRTDRVDVFNGFNKVTARDWENLCRPHGLQPISAAGAEPAENDPLLFRNLPPHPHACIGGVFRKEGPETPSPSLRVVLSLLTWNTRIASLDSLQAYLREAEMLQRLGHQPLICVCDNGSDDGTAKALRALDDSIPFPHRFILNSANLGNCVARNQIIDYAREVSASYVLFMDGDIEIVPFSSFAMLRYLETHGRRLGCVGAFSMGQTTLRERASKALFSIDPKRVESTNIVGWTQYGMFRCALFEDDIQFDTTDPFNGPGWGYEDNDLAFQMELKGYRNDYFSGITYLHRNVRSSVQNLRRAGIDPNVLCQRRKQYLIEKWSSHPGISAGPLDQIRRGHIAL